MDNWVFRKPTSAIRWDNDDFQNNHDVGNLDRCCKEFYVP